MTNGFKQIRLRLYNEQHGLCWWCGQLTDNSDFASLANMATIDHLLPQYQRPDLKKDKCNMVLSCNTCNNRRSLI